LNSTQDHYTGEIYLSPGYQGLDPIFLVSNAYATIDAHGLNEEFN
jgi:hypothetical protein